MVQAILYAWDKINIHVAVPEQSISKADVHHFTKFFVTTDQITKKFNLYMITLQRPAKLFNTTLILHIKSIRHTVMSMGMIVGSVHDTLNKSLSSKNTIQASC
jgi:hypothetical protein